MKTKIKQLIGDLKRLNAEYAGVKERASKTEWKWPFDSKVEIELRTNANRICGAIMRIERQIIDELLK